MKRIIKDYFSFSKKERLAVIILLLTMGCFIAFPYFYSPILPPPIINNALAEFIREQNTQMDSAENVLPKPSPKNNQYAIKGIQFPFDPNTASENDWKRLGIQEKTIQTLVNYRNKGGKFKQAQDLRKIWGFRKEDADRLLPFVHIAKSDTFFSTQKTNQEKWKLGAEGPPKTKASLITFIDINSASIEDWKSLPGIGEVLAGRIIKFRDRIGGFSGIEQVQKTYGISDSVFKLITPYLKVNTKTINRLNINTANAYDLRIRTNLPDVVAKAIIVYRQQNGPFKNVGDLKKIVILSDSLFQMLILHVSLE